VSFDQHAAANNATAAHRFPRNNAITAPKPNAVANRSVDAAYQYAASRVIGMPKNNNPASPPTTPHSPTQPTHPPTTPPNSPASPPSISPDRAGFVILPPRAAGVAPHFPQQPAHFVVHDPVRPQHAPALAVERAPFHPGRPPARRFHDRRARHQIPRVQH